MSKQAESRGDDIHLTLTRANAANLTKYLGQATQKDLETAGVPRNQVKHLKRLHMDLAAALEQPQ